MRRVRNFLLLAALIPVAALAEEPLAVAVASNFLSTAQEISAAFTASTGTQVRLSSGSTAKLYAQIVNGAPYDVFLAADAARPGLLLDNGLAVPGSRMTYALGSLVLWSTDSRLRGKDCRAALDAGDYRHLAIANPLTAPYGRAAREFLQASDLWEGAKSRLVFGENISQTFQFVASGNATLGLVASSQLTALSPFVATCSWPVESPGLSPILQDGVILRRATNQHHARSFMKFIRAPRAIEILQRSGYSVPLQSSVDAE